MAFRGESLAPSHAMDNWSLQAKIRQLEILFPHQSTAEISRVLELLGEDFHRAVDVLSGSPGPSFSYSASTVTPSSSKTPNYAVAEVKSESGDYKTLKDIPNHKTREKVANLLGLVSCPIGFVLDVLGNCNWDVDQAAMVFLNGMIPIDLENEHMTEGSGRFLGDNDSIKSTTFSPTPPRTPFLPLSPHLQERFRGGIVPGFVYTSKSQSTSTQSQTEQAQSPPLEEENSKHKTPPKLNSNNAFDNHVEMGNGPEENLSGVDILGSITSNGTSSKMNGDVNEQIQQTNSTYGFDAAGIGQDEMSQKVAQLKELLPSASTRRCKAILQIYPETDEAFDVMYDELVQFGSDVSSEETDEDDDSSEGSELARSQKGKGCNIRESSSSESSRRQQKRRAETPEHEPPVKKPRVAAEEELDAEVEAAMLEPAGDWVLNTFGESDGISITLANGEHPCKFPKGLLWRHFIALREQLGNQTPAEVVDKKSTALDLSDFNRGHFDQILQMAITKSVRLHDSQCKTRSTEITALLELVFPAIRLELLGAGTIIAARIKEILIDKRNALQGKHIETAYTLESGHPIRKVIVRSLGRAHFTLEESQTSKAAQIYRRGEGDNARRSAFAGDRFIFHDQLDSIEEFSQDLARQTVDMLHDRHVAWSRSGKTKTITYFDPLSREGFIL